jgi:hypothetical protein
MAEKGIIGSLTLFIVLASLGLIFFLFISSIAPFTSPKQNLYNKPTARAVTSRNFFLSSTAVQAVPYQSSFYQDNFSQNTLATDVDVLTIFGEFYGIPWTEFASGPTPNANNPWTIKLLSLAQQAHVTNKPISLQLLLTRKKLTQIASNNNGSLVVQDWPSSNDCYDFSQFSQSGTDANAKYIAYLNYTKWMVNTFQPKYLNIGVELNLYYHDCNPSFPRRWDSLVSFENTIYDQIKSTYPNMIVFPSIQLESLYNNSLTGIDDNAYAALSSLKRDRFAISTYPMLVGKSGGGFISPADLPADYLTRAAEKGGEKELIAETGWNSQNLNFGTPTSCNTLIPSDETKQATYLQYVLDTAQAKNITLVTWWSNRDLMPATVMTACYPLATSPNYPECNGDPWCVADNLFKQSNADPNTGEYLFKLFGAMGIKDYNGTAKVSTASIWQQALANTISLLQGDLDGDRSVTIFDYNILVGNFNKSGVGPSGGDINGNGIVDIFDYNALVGNFGKISF